MRKLAGIITPCQSKAAATRFMRSPPAAKNVATTSTTTKARTAKGSRSASRGIGVPALRVLAARRARSIWARHNATEYESSIGAAISSAMAVAGRCGKPELRSSRRRPSIRLGTRSISTGANAAAVSRKKMPRPMARPAGGSQSHRPSHTSPRNRPMTVATDASAGHSCSQKIVQRARRSARASTFLPTGSSALAASIRRSIKCKPPMELPVVTEPRLRPAVGRAKETFTSRGQTYWQSRPVPAPPLLADAERPAGRSTHLRSSRERDIVVLQRDRADALARCRKERIEHGRRSHEDRRLADAAPESTRRHDDRFDFGHLSDPHRVVGIEVGLLDAAVFHGALAVEQSGEAVDEGARDLAVDLRRVDRVAGIGGTDDAVDFDLVAARHRDFGRRRDVAAVAHLLREAAIDALWCRLAPAHALGHRVEHGEMLGMFRHQLAPEFERVLAGRMGELVHEALEIERVLIVVHAAPEPRRDRRIDHRVLDEQVRDTVAELPLGAARVEPLERDRVASSFCEACRSDGGQDRLAGNAHMQSGQIIIGVERADEPALRDRMIDPVGGVFLARLDELDRRSRHLLGDPHRVRYEFAASAPPEAAADQHLVHVAFAHWQS